MSDKRIPAFDVRKVGTLEEEARDADINLRGSMRWAITGAGSPGSLRWAANGAAAEVVNANTRICELEVELTILRAVAEAARKGKVFMDQLVAEEGAGILDPWEAQLCAALAKYDAHRKGESK